MRAVLNSATAHSSSTNSSSITWQQTAPSASLPAARGSLQQHLHAAAAAPRPCVAAHASVNQDDRASSSKRLQQLWEVGMDEGWSVAPAQQAAPSSSSSSSSSAQPQAAPAARRKLGRKAVLASRAASPAGTASPAQQQAPAAGTGASSTGPRKRTAAPRSPYMDLQSDSGVMGLALLQARLASGEAGGLSAAEVASLKDKMEAVRAAKAGQAGPMGSRPVGGRRGMKNMQQAIKSAAKAQKKRVVYVDDDDNIIGEEDEAEDITDAAEGPAFSLTIGEDDTEFAEYDARGNVVRRSSASFDTPAAPAGRRGSSTAARGWEEVEEAEEDDLDFGDAGSGWGVLGRATAQRRATAGDADGEEPVDLTTGQPLSAREVEVLLGGQGAQGAGSLLGGADEADEAREWGLEELPGSRPQQSLMEQLGVVPDRKAKRAGRPDLEPGALQGTLLGEGASVQWGGSGINGVPAGADLAEQEALLSRMFKPHKVKELLAHQRAAYAASVDLKKGASTRGKFGAEAKLHRQLRIVAGSAANKRLVSSQGAQTRPMMEKVRAAIFNMILSQAGSPSELPPGSRWLDLFAGTGSVGLEALSRGAAQAHFVEMDPWVTRNILGPNITTCAFEPRSVVHTSKAEEFLRRARSLPRFAGGAFDFISMCPPYLLVSYPELFSLLDGSPLLHDGTILFVEYPKQLSHQVPDSVGSLVKVRDRKYGRTWIAVYAPPGSGELTRARADQEDDEDELELDF